MTSRLTKIQLIVFTIVTLLTATYGAQRFFDVGAVVNPPYTVTADFARAGGIYERADVDLLGTRVGKVAEIRPVDDGGTVVLLEIDDGVEIPRDVTAQIGSKSAIGEQYVELTPRSTDGPALEDGDAIPRAQTTSPMPIEQLIGNLDALAGSVPIPDIATVLDELSTAVFGMGPDLGRLLDGSNDLTRAYLDNMDSLTALIHDARSVLDSQVALGSSTTTYLRELAPLLETVRSLNPDVAALFAHGAQAATELTRLLADNEEALPALLGNLVSLNATTASRLPSLRKTLVVFPWVLELIGTAVRHCTHLNPDGTGVAGTCEYDDQGRPKLSAHLAVQLSESPGKPPYQPCTDGYEGTTRYLPNGQPMDGDRPESPDEEPNLDAHCKTSPYDPISPNVRGPNKIPGADGAARPAPGWAVYDERSGLVVAPDGTAVRLTGTTGPRPPQGDDGLAWLLSRPTTP